MNSCKKFFFQTLGCKVNQYETEAMQKLFELAGWRAAEKISIADVVVVNTCTVTSVSSQKSRQMIRRAIKMNPDCILAVVGCYAQSEPEKISAIEGVDVIIGTKDRTKIVEFVEAALLDRKKIFQVNNVNDIYDFEELPHTPNRTRAFLKIEDGCNNFCSYCIIPYVRGRVRSRSLSSIREECLELKAAGYKEIVLTGIHIGAYGHDLDGKISLIDAVETVLNSANPLRLRLGSIEATEMNDKLIELLKNDKRICNHVHLPLQSGCDEILRAMHRPYTTENFSRLTAKLIAKVLDISIGTDLIVGFPGETDENFSRTLEFIKAQPFSKIHVFPYSARAGTIAASLTNQISPQVKKLRAAQALEISRIKVENFSRRLIGKTVEIIAETETDNIIDGMTENYVRVYVRSENIQLGSIIRVQVKKIFRDGVWAEKIV